MSGLEIERKFIVPELTEDIIVLASHSQDIRQGYLAIDPFGNEVRLRDASGEYSLTVKSKGMDVRGEWEVEIDEAQFRALWPATADKRLEKTRHHIEHEAHQLELDVYLGRLTGLVVVEIEFHDETAASQFNPLPWFGKEVTRDKTYKNQQLASQGMPN